ncbi:hypothetical protein PC123_g19184 [Phytophthora cactorum]|nr:hypothetical protein PC123_g19184 [Phytophthora cactorum]
MEGIGAADGFKKGVSRASDSKDRPFTLMGGPRLPAAPLRSDLATQSLNFAKSVELQVRCVPKLPAGLPAGHCVRRFSFDLGIWGNRSSAHICSTLLACPHRVSDTVQFQIHLERSNWSQRVGCREWQQQNTTART